MREPWMMPERDDGRHPRFVPGWWIVPFALLGLAAWIGILWKLAKIAGVVG